MLYFFGGYGLKGGLIVFPIQENTNGRGLEIDFESCSLLQQKLEKQLGLYDQETQPYVISELVKQVIRNEIIDKKIDPSLIENFEEDERYDWILFKNCFDTSFMPLTPINDTPPENELWKIPAAILMGLISSTGHKVASYKGEMKGRLAHMVMPALNNEVYKSRSTKQLMPHTEIVNGLWPEEIFSNNAGYCIAPNVFGLASIRNPAKCATRVWYLEGILKSLPFSIVRDLMRPEFSTTSQSSFDVEHNLEGVSVISQFGDRMSIRFSYSKLKGDTIRAKNALKRLKEYLDDANNVDRLIVEPGQVLILNNRTLLHGRDDLKNDSFYDGNDRWLIRMYGFSHDGWKKLPKKEHLQHVATL